VKLVLCTLVLNEMEWLPKLYQQHKDWPGLIQWIFIESADLVYQNANSHLVTPGGLSTDGTTEYLERLATTDDRITHIKLGTTTHENPELGKITSRNAYMTIMETIQPEFFLVLDADEFYCTADQSLINSLMETDDDHNRHYCFQFTHIWHPPSIADEPLFSLEINGGFWAMRHTKGVRWSPGLQYRVHHQRPDLENEKGAMKSFSTPACIHMAFAADPVYRLAKNVYYERRGEWADWRRRSYCRSRDVFRTWQPDSILPLEITVTSYSGPIPECFTEETI
jgi:hypothetical protein